VSEADLGDWLVHEMLDHFELAPDQHRERCLAKELTR